MVNHPIRDISLDSFNRFNLKRLLTPLLGKTWRAWALSSESRVLLRVFLNPLCGSVGRHAEGRGSLDLNPLLLEGWRLWVEGHLQRQLQGLIVALESHPVFEAELDVGLVERVKVVALLRHMLIDVGKGRHPFRLLLAFSCLVLGLA